MFFHSKIPQNVGCDWKLNSHVIDDQCGICDGDGTGCNIVNGTLDVSDEGEKVFHFSIVKIKLDGRKSRKSLPFPPRSTTFLPHHKKVELFNSFINHQPVGGI